jgi:hypothetical protein
MMSNDTLEKIVCLRNSRTAVTVLKKIYVDEAKHVAHDISASLRLGHCHRLRPLAGSDFR